MVQPRKEQIKNVLTRHARFSLTPLPGVWSTAVPAASLNPFLISDTAGGAQQDLPATASGNMEPFVLAVADSINVGIDGGGPAVVTFSGTETAASQVARAINVAVGLTVAVDDAGRLRILSPTAGEASEIVLSDGVPGTLAKLGLVAGTYSGVEAPVRGALTRTPVTATSLVEGGFVPLRTTDGKNLVTNCPAVYPVQVATRRVDVPGGVPIHARLTYDSGLAQYLFTYFARAPLDPEAVTFNSSFGLLAGTDSLTLTFGTQNFGTVGPVTVTFPAGPGLTRDQVVARINARYAEVVFGSPTAGQASVRSTVTGPYSFPVSTPGSIIVGIDGTDYAVSFGPGTWTTAQVTAAISAAIVGGTSTAVFLAGENLVFQIESNNTDGRTSSVTLKNGTPGTLEELGLTAGTYRGSFIAEPYGPSQIRIRGLQRGPDSYVTVAGSPTTLTRMGLTAGTYYGSLEGDVPVQIPTADVSAPATAVRIVALVPEVLEFGEVDPAVESVVEQFNAKSAGSSFAPNSLPGDIRLFPSGGAMTGKSLGVENAGKPLVLNPYGLADLAYVRAARDDAYRFFKKIIRGDFTPEVNQVYALVTNLLETPSQGNPRTETGTLTVSIDPSDIKTSRTFEVEFGVNGVQKVPFTIKEFAAPVSGLNWLINAEEEGLFGSWNVPMRAYDPNMNAAGTAVGGTRWIPFTSSAAAEGDRTLRIMELEEAALEPVSLFRQVNARFAVTCGDGTTSFGDFNGTDAIQQALAFRAAHAPGSSVLIRLKSGMFVVNAANGTIDVSDEVTIVGQGTTHTTIANADASSDVIMFTGASASLHIRDLTIGDSLSSGSNGINTAGVQGNLRLERVRMRNCTLRLENLGFSGGEKYTFHVRDSEFSQEGSGVPCVGIFLDDGQVHGKHEFLGCSFFSDDDNPAVRITATTGSGQPWTYLEELLFDGCKMRLRSTTSSGGNLAGNCGVLDLDANGSNSNSASEGVTVGKIAYRDCDVLANVESGAVSILMHLTTSSNGVSWDAVTDRMNVSRLEIDGGSWLAQGVSTLFNPFTCMNVGTYSSSFPAAQGGDPGGLYVRNVRMGFNFLNTNGLSHGSATADVDGAVWEGSGDPAPADIDWAAFAMSAGYLWVENVDFTGFSQLGDSGDLAVKVLADGEAYLSNVRFSNYRVGGPGLAPGSRLRIRPQSIAKSTVLKDVRFNGETITSSVWAGYGILVIDPNSIDRQVDGSCPIMVDGLQVDGFYKATMMIEAAIYLWGGINFGDLYTDSPQDYRNITIQNCVTRYLAHFIEYYINTVNNYISNLKVLNNTVTQCGNEGIWLCLTAAGLNAFDTIIISGNYVTECGGEGIWLVADYWEAIGPPSRGSFMIVTDNHVFNNDTGELGIQMLLGYFGLTTVANQNPGGVVQGNNATLDRGSEAFIQIRRSDGAGNPAALQTGSPTLTRIRGANTGINIPAAPTVASQLTYTNSTEMLHNVARLLTP